MTIEKLIAKVKEEKPNSFTDAKLISFITEIEAEVAEQLGVQPPVYSGFYMPAPTQPTTDTWNSGNGWYLPEGNYFVEQTGETMDTTSYTYYIVAEPLAPAPYDKLYTSYLKSQIDYANEEYESYQNNAAQHVQDFRDFADWVVRAGVKKQCAYPRRFFNVL